MDHFEFRESANLSWVFLNVSILLVLGIYIVRESRIDGFYATTSVRLAIGMFFYHLGSMLYRGWATLVLWAEHNTQYLVDPRQHVWFGLMAAIIAMMGGLCVIRILTPVHWPPWRVNLPWFITYLVCVGAGVTIAHLDRMI